MHTNQESEFPFYTVDARKIKSHRLVDYVFDVGVLRVHFPFLLHVSDSLKRPGASIVDVGSYRLGKACPVDNQWVGAKIVMAV